MQTTSWIILVVAGLLECAWAVGLKYTDGFTKPLATVLVILAIIASMGLLGMALRHLPVGTGYAVWVGIGAMGTALFGILVLKEPATLGRIFFLLLMATSIIGLKLTSGVAE